MSADAFACRWTASSAEFDAAAALITRLMPLDPDYISHSEIQWGMSPDGQRWREDAPRHLVGYIDWVRRSRDAGVAVAAEPSGVLLGAVIVTWELDLPGQFATVQDVLVEPAERRSGVGAQLLAFVEAEAVARGCRWLFLESGVRNGRAHAFFERQGFAAVSHTFAKPLTPEAGR